MTMLEEMAIAHFGRWRDGKESAVSPGTALRMWESQSPTFRGEMLACMVAALKVLREPTDAMLTAAIAPYRAGNSEDFNEAYKKTVAAYLGAMIDVVLKEAP